MNLSILMGIVILSSVNRGTSTPNINMEKEDDSALIKEFDNVITIEEMKQQLNDKNIFDWQDKDFNNQERKEVERLFEAMEIAMTSRSRQPQTVHKMVFCFRTMERVFTKMLKEKLISKSLAKKFDWSKINERKRRSAVPQTNSKRVYSPLEQASLKAYRILSATAEPEIPVQVIPVKLPIYELNE